METARRPLVCRHHVTTTADFAGAVSPPQTWPRRPHLARRPQPVPPTSIARSVSGWGDQWRARGSKMPQRDADITVAEALRFLAEQLAAPQFPREWTHYGYDLHLPHVVALYLVRVLGRDRDGVHNSREAEAISPAFMDAAWHLVRRGVIRPTVHTLGAQAVSDGLGFSLTESGRGWLSQHVDRLAFIPSEPSAIADLLGRFRSTMGEGFHSRAQEAVACEAGGHWLACCAMCGAAAESMLLRVAEAKIGDPLEVLSRYRRASGRREIVNAIVGQLGGRVAESFRNQVELLNYWRDDAAHGLPSEIGELEAVEAVIRLLRFAQFVSEHWATLTDNS